MSYDSMETNPLLQQFSVQTLLLDVIRRVDEDLNRNLSSEARNDLLDALRYTHYALAHLSCFKKRDK